MKVEQLIDDILFRVGDPQGSVHPRESVRRTIDRIYKQLNLQLRVLQGEVVFDASTNPLNETQIMVIGTDMSLDNASTDRNVVVAMDGAEILNTTYTGATSATTFISDLQALMDPLDYVTMTTVLNAGITEITLTFGNFPYEEHVIAFTETITDALPGSLFALISHQAYFLAEYFTLPSDWHIPYRMDPLQDFVYPEIYKDMGNLRCVFTIEDGLIYFSGADVEGFKPITVGYWALGKDLVEKVADALTETDSPEWRKDLHDVLFYAGAIETSGEYAQFQMDLLSFRQRRIDLSRSVKVLSDVNPQITPWNNQAKGYGFGYGRTGQRYVGPKPYYNDQDK